MHKGSIVTRTFSNIGAADKIRITAKGNDGFYYWKLTVNGVTIIENPGGINNSPGSSSLFIIDGDGSNPSLIHNLPSYITANNLSAIVRDEPQTHTSFPSTKKIRYYTNNNYTLSNEITTNRWYHLVFSFDGKHRKIYMDGRLINKDFATYTPSGTDSVIGGRLNFFDNGFRGHLHDFRYYGRSLTDNEVYRIKEFDEVIGDETLYYPLSDKLNLGKPVIRELGPFVQNDTNGNSDSGKIRVTDYDARLDTNSFTFSAWVYSGFHDIASPSDGGQTIYAGSNGTWVSTMRGYDIILRANLIQATIHNNANYIRIEKSFLKVGKWFHVTLTYDHHSKKKAELYIDGASIGTKYGPYEPRTTGYGKGNIGIGYGQYSYFTGAIDDVRFFNRATTQEEVTAIMAGETINDELLRLPELLNKPQNDILRLGSVGLTDQVFPYFAQSGSNGYAQHLLKLPWSSRFYSDNFSIAFWVRATAISQNNTIYSDIIEHMLVVGILDGVYNTLGFEVRAADNSGRLSGYLLPEFSPTGNLNQWKHVVFTFKKDGSLKRDI